MKLNFSYKLGVRAVKSAIAVFICFALGSFFKWGGALNGSVAAIICMQPTFRQTRFEAVHRIIGTIAGGLLGYAALKLLLLSPEAPGILISLAAALGILALMYICNIFNVQAAAVLACITFMSIIADFDMTGSEAFFYVLYQTADTVFGILIAMLLNWIFPPPALSAEASAEDEKGKTQKDKK